MAETPKDHFTLFDVRVRVFAPVSMPDPVAMGVSDQLDELTTLLETTARAFLNGSKSLRERKLKLVVD